MHLEQVLGSMQVTCAVLTPWTKPNLMFLLSIFRVGLSRLEYYNKHRDRMLAIEIPE